MCACVCLCTIMFRTDTVQEGEVNVLCVLMCKCVFTHTAHTQMGTCEWVYGWNLSSASQPRPSLYTLTRLCQKHFLIKRRWQIIMILRWLWSSLTYCNSLLKTITFAFYEVQTQQRSSNINTMEKGHLHQRKTIQRQKPRDPSRTTKGRWKDAASEDGEVATLVCISEASVPCYGELGETGGFAVLHRFSQTLKSQSKYCETLHNATRDS